MGETRLKLLIAYDGRPFRGWQSQASHDAVQDFLEAAFAKIVGRRVAVHGSGRTDAGVHALGQVAHADVPRASLPIAAWVAALNANLPAGVRVLRVTRAAGDFHARFDARGKVYVYRLWNSPTLHPLEIGRAWHVPKSLDPALLRAALRLYEGTHDFVSFAANRRRPERSTVRTIHATRVTVRRELITLRFEGDGFLYKMVRLLTGAAVRVAQGSDPLATISARLTAPGEEKSRHAAPADGLYLLRVLYGNRRKSSQATD